VFTAERYLGAGSALASAHPAFRVRPGQMALADAVARAFTGEGHLVAEAGTGVGKSLAYLIPAAFAGRRIVVSTATRALQDQLRSCDLPLARLATGRPLTAAVVKGRANYLCRAQAATAGGRLDLGLHDPLARLGEWMLTTRTGDRDELDHLPPADVWHELAVGPDRCRGPACRERARCFSEAARARASEVDVVLVNHALYMSDLALRAGSGGGAAILPPHDLVVFDEAHELEDAAADALGVRLSHLVLARFARDVDRAATAARRDPPEIDLAALQLHGERLFGALPAGRVRLTARDLERLPAGAADGMRAALRGIATRLRGGGEEADSLARHADRLGFALEAIFDGGDDAATVVWSERDRLGRAELRTAPVDVAPQLEELLFDAVQAAVLVSATLAVGDSFAHVRRRLGIGSARELIVDSPFAHASQARVYVPRGIAGDAPTLRVADEIRRLVLASRGRALLLFTSLRRLDEVHRLLAPDLPFPVLRQGEAPRERLLERFRREVDSVLFGSASFWQGVDVPGEALSLVVLDKLPFAPPDEPLVAARVEHAERQGGSGFVDVQLPRAALLLKQGYGRLLRTEDDVGVVAVLDDRLLTRRYGAGLLAALPPARLEHDVEAVRVFLAPATAEREPAGDPTG
jgi:ATP-dependent DNA helicase DinG